MVSDMTDSVSSDNTVTEGKATVFTPKSVFYNPVQEFNRDLTIAVISLHAKQHLVQQKSKDTTTEEEGKSI